MTLDQLLQALPPRPLGTPSFPRNLLGAFRRKSITFCNGLTDETTPVFWFQSRSFTLDLRLPGLDQTALTERQGWVGDTVWDAAAQEMTWSVARGYQLHDQWPEPARFAFIGNSVLEFAPSGAYVEDWRQQAVRGPLLGLRLMAMEDATGTRHAMEGGLIVAGEHVAFAHSRLPAVDAALAQAPRLDEALAAGIASAAEIESGEVSVALDGEAITHTTQPARLGEPIAPGPFTLMGDGTVRQDHVIAGARCVLFHAIDVYEPDHAFVIQTPATAAAMDWLDAERSHLLRNACRSI